MQKVTLPQGLKVIVEHKQSNAVVIEMMVNVGSDDEAPDERGIAHFLEHLLFEGTTKRPTNLEISNEIEKIGGDFNAYTTNGRTCFHIKVLKKHFAIAVEILSDILQNSLFKSEHIEKEKKIVLKEIDMVNDEPRFYQWILLQQHLFKKHPCRYPTYGDRKIIQNLTREKVISYFEKYYLANNMTLAIVGDIKNWRPLVKQKFNLKKGILSKKTRPHEPAAGRMTTIKEKRKVANTYLVLGFKTVPRTHKDSSALEVINGVLGRGQSGRMFTEIRGRRGLAYDVGTQHSCEGTFGYFAAYASIDKKNTALVQNLILKEIEQLKNISSRDLQEAKDFIEGDYLLSLEDNQKVADQILFWEQMGNIQMMDKFIPQIKKVSLEDVQQVVKKYFRNPTVIIIEGR